MALAVLATVTLPGCQAAPSGKPAAITYDDAQNLPPDILKERIMAQLSDIVTPAAAPPRWRRLVNPDRFYDTWLATRPRLDEGGAMCTYELLRVKLDPDFRDEQPDSDTPTHAIGIDTSAWFTPAPRGAKDCAERAPTAAHYFETDDPLRAELDFAMLKNVVAGLGSPTPGFEATCSGTDNCGKLQAKPSADTLWDISACNRTVADGQCRHFSWREPEHVEMDVIYDTPRLDRRILRVHVEPGVVL